VYSLGVILYEALSGRRPHEGDSLLEILHKVVTQKPVRLESVRPGLASGVYLIVVTVRIPLRIPHNVLARASTA
jgi:hypothetical protein